MDRRIDINLLPPEFQPQPAVRWHPIYLAFLYALAAFLVLYVIIGSMNRIKALEADIAQTNKSIQKLQPFADAYDMSEQSVRSLENLKQLFVYLDGQYVDWPLFFYHLEPNLPKGVWLTSVSAEVVTKAPVEKKTPAKPAAPAQQPAAGQAAAPAQPAAPAEPGAPPTPTKKVPPSPPKHTGDITLQGESNGYSLAPLATLLKNLQNDPFFVTCYLEDSSLDESEDGVTRSFSIVVRMKDPKHAAEEEAEKKTKDSPAKRAAGDAEGGQAK